MDNRSIDVIAEGDEGIEYAVKLITHQKHYKLIATHYKITILNNITTLILYRFNDDNAQTLSLPFELDTENMITFIRQWLNKVEYPGQPDHDGDNAKGWRIFTDAWGHVDHSYCAIIGIQPKWAMYGK